MDLPNELLHHIGNYLSPVDVIHYYRAVRLYEVALKRIMILSPREFGTFLATVSIKDDETMSLILRSDLLPPLAQRSMLQLKQKALDHISSLCLE